jgi:hypothetical protein
VLGARANWSDSCFFSYSKLSAVSPGDFPLTIKA